VFLLFFGLFFSELRYLMEEPIGVEVVSEEELAAIDLALKDAQQRKQGGQKRPQIPLGDFLKKLQKKQRTMKKVVQEDGDVEYYAEFMNNYDAEKLFAELRQVAWEQEEVVIFGKKLTAARLVKTFGDKGTKYTYSGLYV
jgi:hypothetical protein